MVIVNMTCPMSYTKVAQGKRSPRERPPKTDGCPRGNLPKGKTAPNTRSPKRGNLGEVLLYGSYPEHEEVWPYKVEQELSLWWSQPLRHRPGHTKYNTQHTTINSIHFLNYLKNYDKNLTILYKFHVTHQLVNPLDLQTACKPINMSSLQMPKTSCR